LTLLRDQFHDVLPGSAVRVVYEGVYRELEGVYREAMGLAEGCAKLIAGEGNELLVFNSLPWDRFGYVKVSEPLPNTQGMGDGYLALVKAPSVGYSVLKPLSPVEPVRLVEDGGGFVLENSRVSARVNLDGTVASVVDKASGRGLLRGLGNVIVAYENAPGWSDAWDVERGFEETAFTIRASEHAVVARGPLYAGVRFTTVQAFNNNPGGWLVCRLP